MKKLKVGIVGAGKIAEVLHVPNTLLSEYAELVAIADPNPQRLEYFKKKLESHRINFYVDYREMFQKESMDAVIVAVPNTLHAEISIAALESGRNVLVEKPMATNSQEALKMIEAAKKSKKVLMVNHSQRFFPHHQRAKEVVQSGILGEIRLVKTMFGHAGPENWSPNAAWFFNKDVAMFGALGDLGVHKVDLIRYITGLDIVQCVGLTATLEKRASVEDVASAVLKLSNSALATLDSNWITKGLEENYFVVYGEKGTMKVGQTDPTKIDIYLDRPFRMHGEIVLKPLFTNEDPYWKMPIIDHFAKVCLGLEEPIVKPEDGYIAVKVVEKIFESYKKGQVVSIE
ncbi:Gfo/Idh/MocA family protein [Pseudothermotoga sp.]|nr:Gfo/Idh/MocA family oxidoreductase [Pseudothermotoga sp.]MCX7812398.1 Gfo/Idh/MocA family oxidoreductase [Pseudothermotoga sp.]MDW8140148.1 Gfo/Idh/MocA family oxidoreductase [Pseudothermotoga sp.]